MSHAKTRDQRMETCCTDTYEAEHCLEAAKRQTEKEMEIGRRRNRWLEDEVRRLATLVQELGVQRETAEGKVLRLCGLIRQVGCPSEAEVQEVLTMGDEG